MVRLDDAVPARLKTHGTTFEVLVDPDGALALKRGDSVNLEDILAVEDVFELEQQLLSAAQAERWNQDGAMVLQGAIDHLLQLLLAIAAIRVQAVTVGAF